MKTQTIIRFLILTVLFGFSPYVAKSQLAVNTGSSIGMTPLEFVQTYLVGTGIAVSNATYNGSSEPLNSSLRLPATSRDEIGSFINNGGAATQLGITGGVVLSSGYVAKTKAGLSPNDDMWGNNQPAESDPDLFILAGSSPQIHDKSILEFDFVPQTDVVTFRYVFGSIEFDGFCGSINDAFGLFLSGPGIAGGLGFTNDAVNIALLPNSTNYVTIFNICAADQGNTGNGVYSWWNSKKDYFSFNRLTYVFTATYNVTCNQTYHMKFAIGDASDGVLDSGVFLEQNSFSSNNITSSTSFSNPRTGQYLVEGCSNVTLSYSIPQTLTSDLSIDLAIHSSGTATQADILPNPFPPHLIIPAGQLQSPTVQIIPVPDALAEGDENLVIKATTLNCGIPHVVTSEFFIKDYLPLSAAMSDVTICNGNPATLTPEITGGQVILPANVYEYQWSSGQTTSSITVSPPAGHHTYTVTVTDACMQTITKTASVDVGTAPVPAGLISGPDTICTPATGITFTVPTITGADSYVWTIPTGAIITAGVNTSVITVDFPVGSLSGPVTVKGHSNVCGDGTPASLTLFVTPGVPAAGNITGPATLCQGPDIVTYSIVPLSYTDSYEWTVPPGVNIITGANTSQINCLFTNTAISGNISVRGHNASCGFGTSANLTVTVNPLPQDAGTITGPSSVCQGPNPVNFSIAPLANATGYLWTVPTGVTIQSGANTNQITTLISISAVSGTITVKGNNGLCGFGIASSHNLTVNPLPSPAGVITGPVTVCQGPEVVTYSIAPINNATSYEWTVPGGVTVVTGGTTNQISCIFTSTAVSGNFTVIGYNNLCTYGTPSQLAVIVNPLPGPAGNITSPDGAVVCKPRQSVTYQVGSITNSVSCRWFYSGSGATITGNGTSVTIDFSADATSGTLTLRGENGCGFGPVSNDFPIVVNPKPTVEYNVCHDLKTTKNGHPIILKGGTPYGTGGVYSGPGVEPVGMGIYSFNPASNLVIGGGTSNGVAHTITYRYTNTYNCSDEKTSIITVYGSNSNDPCPGSVKDIRDNKIYPTFLVGGPNTQCWLASNLNYGSELDHALPQTDNCIAEKYCQNNLAPNCNTYGGYYQWDELLAYYNAPGYQDICMPGWHVATVADWNNLIAINNGNADAGAKLKDLLSPNGFHAMLEGIYYQNHTWAYSAGLLTGTMFWTSEITAGGQATARGLNSFNPSVSLYQSGRGNAYPVRCVRN